MRGQQLWIGIGDPDSRVALHAALAKAGLRMRWVGVQETSGGYQVAVNIGHDPANPDDERTVELLTKCVNNAVEQFRSARPGQLIEVAGRREDLPPEVR